MAGPGYKFTAAMLIGGVGGFLIGRHVYDVLVQKTKSVSRQESPRANAESIVAGVIGAGVMAGALNIGALAVGSPLAKPITGGE